MSEYGWEVDYALHRPLAQAFALYEAIKARYGAKPAGPTYAERVVLAAIGAAKPSP